MPTLVTGTTGLLGNNIARQLLARGTAVRVMVREGSDPRPLEGLNVEIALGDVRDADSVERACTGVDAVFHSAALVAIGWQGMEKSRRINVEGTRHVARAARAAGARMVHVSSIDALGLGTAENPATEATPYQPHVPCPYAITKREAELALLELVDEGLDAVIVNPGFMLGPWDWKPSSGRMLLEVASGKAWFAPRGMNEFCSAEDVAAGAIAALEKGARGERYILAGERLIYLDAFRMFAEITGGRRPLRDIGPRCLYLAGKFGDLKTKLTGRETDVNSAAIAMAQLPRYYSHERAKQELGYQPRPVREAAQDAWDWFCEYGYAKKK